MGTTIGSGGSGRGTKIQVLPSQTNTGPKIADIVVGGETIELKSPQFSGTISEQDLDTIQQAVEIADDVNKLKDDKVDRSDIDALVDDSGEETGTLSDDDECVPSSKLVKSEIAKISAKVGEILQEGVTIHHEPINWLNPTEFKAGTTLGNTESNPSEYGQEVASSGYNTTGYIEASNGNVFKILSSVSGGIARITRAFGYDDNYQVVARIATSTSQNYVYEAVVSDSSIKYVRIVGGSNFGAANGMVLKYSNQEEAESAVLPTEYSAYFEPYDEFRDATIRDELVGTSSIKDSSVTSVKLADGSITLNKMADGVCFSDKSRVGLNSLGDLRKDGTINSSEYLLCDGSIHISKNAVITARIDGTIGTGVGIGCGYDSDYGGSVFIEPTRLDIREKGVSTHEKYINFPSDFSLDSITTIQIVTSYNGKAKAIVTNGAGNVFVSDSFRWGVRVGVPFAYNGNSNSIGCKLSFFPADIDKQIWIFGDSYFSWTSSNRWPYWLRQWGYEDYLMDARPGKNATEGLESVKTLLSMGYAPKFIVWCHGMNGANDSETSVNSTWLAKTTELISICKSKSITLVLATIPSVHGDGTSAHKPRPHSYMNSWIREQSGCRYIDFASAVENGVDDYWRGYNYNDPSDHSSELLNNVLGDGVHPTVKGAVVLATKFIQDFPEIAINFERYVKSPADSLTQEQITALLGLLN